MGEVHCDSFPVNFSKDGFAWDGGLEDALIDALLPVVREYGQKADNIRKGRQNVVGLSDVRKSLEQTEDHLAVGTLARDLALLEIPVPGAVDRALDVGVQEALVSTSEGPHELKVPMPGGSWLTARLFEVFSPARVACRA